MQELESVSMLESMERNVPHTPSSFTSNNLLNTHVLSRTVSSSIYWDQEAHFKVPTCCEQSYCAQTGEQACITCDSPLSATIPRLAYTLLRRARVKAMSQYHIVWKFPHSLNFYIYLLD